MRAFRFGVNVLTAGSRTEWADKARQIEDLGYSTLTVPDHLTEMLAPVPAMLAAADATTTLRVGTGVLNNDLRHPALVAREAAAVDLLTDGRLQLGLGAGYAKSEYDQAGLRYDRGSARVERLAEAVAIIERLFTGEPVSFEGRYSRVTGHRIHPRPIQHPRPPILIGGNGPRLLTLAAKEADVVGLTGLTFRRGGTEPDLSGWQIAGVEERMKLIRDVAGDRHERLELNALVQRVVVTDDRRRAARELAGRWKQLSVDEILETPYVLVGAVDEMVDDLRPRRQRWSISYYTIHEPYLDALAPVVARLAGTS